ncbi:N-6 DNA methylase [Candidatus Vecturithrix granuli]|uniref:site-specific DNA-methyltransferase (adenine-specific) n=1 Tax=Vecturithrix granuli TaxID=1499967 RepID=A0A081CAY2_VECG1|nr:N-6 DNA methylase [Candidatus Vecturithrix granuli]
MLKSLNTIVKRCCQLLAKDFSQCDPNPSEEAVRNVVLDCFLEIAALCCLEAHAWNSFEGPYYSQIRHGFRLMRRNLQAECPYLTPFFSFCQELPTENTCKIVWSVLKESISCDEWRTEHILGWMYQAALQGAPEQKQQGQFYTAKPIIEAIVAQVFPLIFHRSSSALTILDLACGAGGFALKAFEELYQWHAQKECQEFSENPATHILANHLFLVDNDPRACQLAALNLYIKAKQLAPDCQIRRMNIVCADALRRWEDESFAPSTQDGVLIKHFFAKKHDVVIGNPPYIVINRRRTPKDTIACYQSYQSAAFKINTFALFVERGLEFLKPDGLLGMIVPNTLLTQVYFEPLRQYILATSRIRSILDIKRVFERAFVENCIIMLQREEDQLRRHQNMMECWMKKPRSAQRDSPKVMQEPDLVNAPATIPQRHFEHAPFSMFNIHIDEQSRVLMEKIARDNPKLGELCESHDGFNPGNAKAKFIMPEPVDKTCKKILNGKDIGRYRLHWGGLYVRYNKALLTKNDNVRWGHLRSLDSPKILTRQTADRLIGAYDSGEYYTTNSIHTTILQQGIQDVHLQYILALLNSKLMSFYYQKLIAEVGQVFSQVKLINLRQLPIKIASKEEQQEIIGLVEKLLHLNTSDLVFQETDTCLDHKICHLYQLTPDEIETIESIADV